MGLITLSLLRNTGPVGLPTRLGCAAGQEGAVCEEEQIVKHSFVFTDLQTP